MSVRLNAVHPGHQEIDGATAVLWESNAVRVDAVREKKRPSRRKSGQRVSARKRKTKSAGPQGAHL